MSPAAFVAVLLVGLFGFCCTLLLVGMLVLGGREDEERMVARAVRELEGEAERVLAVAAWRERAGRN